MNVCLVLNQLGRLVGIRIGLVPYGVWRLKMVMNKKWMYFPLLHRLGRSWSADKHQKRSSKFVKGAEYNMFLGRTR